jgi:hypothetical protein
MMPSIATKFQYVNSPKGKKDNIRIDLGEVGWGDVDWIGLTKDRNR